MRIYFSEKPKSVVNASRAPYQPSSHPSHLYLQTLFPLSAQQTLTPCSKNQAQTRRNAETEPCKPGRARRAGERTATAAALPAAWTPGWHSPAGGRGFTDVCAAGQNLPHTLNGQKTWDVQSLREISPDCAGISKHFQRRWALISQKVSCETGGGQSKRDGKFHQISSFRMFCCRSISFTQQIYLTHLYSQMQETDQKSNSPGWTCATVSEPNKKTVCCVFPCRGPGGKIFCCWAVVVSIVILPPPRVPPTLPVRGRKAWGTGGHSDNNAAAPSGQRGKGLQKTLLLSSGHGQVGNHPYSGGQQGRRIIARWQRGCFTSVFWQLCSCAPGWGIPAAPPAQRRYQQALGNRAHANSKPHYGCLLRKQPHHYRQG